MLGRLKRAKPMSLSASDLSSSCHRLGDSHDEPTAHPSGFAKAARPPRAARPEEEDRIALGDIHALLDWCERLGCTEDELRDAVRKAGPRLRGVKRALGKELHTRPMIGALLR